MGIATTGLLGADFFDCLHDDTSLSIERQFDTAASYTGSADLEVRDIARWISKTLEERHSHEQRVKAAPQ
jgi:hypothetical protein